MLTRRYAFAAAGLMAAALLVFTMPDGFAQDERERKPLREMFDRVEAVRGEVKPARAAPSDVQVIRADEISAEPPLIFEVQEVQGGGMNAGGSQLAKPETPPLDITLTPRDPAFFNRAYLQYEYPRNVYINNSHAWAEYSEQNVPGVFKYTLRLDGGKKYLVEVEADTDAGSGDVVHRLGGVESTHEVGLDLVNISRIVEPAETGWIQGSVRRANSNMPNAYRVYSVSVTELE